MIQHNEAQNQEDTYADLNVPQPPADNLGAINSENQQMADVNDQQRDYVLPEH